MRPVQIADIEAAARALGQVQPAQRAALMDQIITRAENAQRFRQITGQQHPTDGAGTMLAVAYRLPMGPRPAAYDAEALNSLMHVIRGLQAHLSHQLA